MAKDEHMNRDDRQSLLSMYAAIGQAQHCIKIGDIDGALVQLDYARRVSGRLAIEAEQATKKTTR